MAPRIPVCDVSRLCMPGTLIGNYRHQPDTSAAPVTAGKAISQVKQLCTKNDGDFGTVVICSMWRELTITRQALS